MSTNWHKNKRIPWFCIHIALVKMDTTKFKVAATGKKLFLPRHFKLLFKPTLAETCQSLGYYYCCCCFHQNTCTFIITNSPYRTPTHYNQDTGTLNVEHKVSYFDDQHTKLNKKSPVNANGNTQQRCMWEKPSKTKSKSVARGCETIRGYSILLVLTRRHDLSRSANAASAENHKFFPFPSHLAPSFGMAPSNLWKSFTVPETRFPGNQRWKFGDPNLHHFWLIHLHDRRTDRRTELRWPRHATAVAAVECKNDAKQVAMLKLQTTQSAYVFWFFVEAQFNKLFKLSAIVASQLWRVVLGN